MWSLKQREVINLNLAEEFVFPASVLDLTLLLSGDTGDYFLRGAPGSTQRCSGHTDGIRKLRINSVFTKRSGVPHIRSSLSFSFRVRRQGAAGSGDQQTAGGHLSVLGYG